MSSSRIESEVNLLKSAIEKLLLEQSEVVESELLDVLVALESIVMSISLLKATMIGITISTVKKRFPNSAVGDKAKSLINKWKDACNIDKKSTSISDNSSASSATSATSLIVEESSSTENHFDFASISKKLPEARFKIIELMANHLKLDCDEDNAKFLAFCIEDCVNSMISFVDDSKGYKEKLKTLSFSLKQNEQLRKNIISGAIQPNELLKMSVNDLATEEIRNARNKIAQDKIMEKRSDLYEEKRSEIQRANGIDPNKGGEFTCGKCKGKKTTNYQMQTRSADEPMTVFIRCLTCGNRWRM